MDTQTEIQPARGRQELPAEYYSPTRKYWMALPVIIVLLIGGLIFWKSRPAALFEVEGKQVELADFRTSVSYGEGSDRLTAREGYTLLIVEFKCPDSCPEGMSDLYGPVYISEDDDRQGATQISMFFDPDKTEYIFAIPEEHGDVQLHFYEETITLGGWRFFLK